MPPKRLTKRGSERREQILEAAYRLFAEQGYHGTTVGDICDDLGVGKGVFYWYFKKPGKAALFNELLLMSLLKLRRAQEIAIEKVDDPVAKIEEGIKASVEIFRNDPGFLSLIRTAARYEEFSEQLHRGQQTVVADTAVHIEKAIADGSIRAGDPEVMAHAILGTIFHLVETYFGTDPDAVDDRPQLADEAVAFCLHGILT